MSVAKYFLEHVQGVRLELAWKAEEFRDQGILQRCTGLKKKNIRTAGVLAEPIMMPASMRPT